jgi:hypothetical protein
VSPEVRILAAFNSHANQLIGVPMPYLELDWNLTGDLALSSAGFNALHPIRRCQILTNLANQLDTVGHFVEARSTGREP